MGAESVEDLMSLRSAASVRPARTFVTGPVTKGLRLFALVASLVITAWLLVRYPSLPDVVATHVDVAGQADDWGPRWSVLVLAGVMLLMSLGVGALSTRPRSFNYPMEITASNAQAVYREGERVLVWTLLGLQMIYLGIAGSMLGTGGSPIAVVGLVALAAALIIGILRMVRAAR